MPERRIETTTSRTAEWVCLSRAASWLESNPCYHSDDNLALRLVPAWVWLVFRTPCLRRLVMRAMAPQGMYEYVIARTKYIDAAMRQALRERFDQVLILGAGFDTRALRFQAEAQGTVIFEVDAPVTQSAKLQQYLKRGLAVPPNVVFLAVDFEKEWLPTRLGEAGFRRQQRSLFILEGLVMYLEAGTVDELFRLIQGCAGQGSRVVFDCVLASVLRGEGESDEAREIVARVAQANERWRFGIEAAAIGEFLATYGLRLVDHRDARGLEEMYFRDQAGGLVGHVNGTHCLVIAESA